VKVAIFISTAEALAVALLGTIVSRASNLRCFLQCDDSKRCECTPYGFVSCFECVLVSTHFLYDA
jgi:hypothetical protein